MRSLELVLLPFTGDHLIVTDCALTDIFLIATKSLDKVEHIVS
jgi:hypothetical protein